MKQETVDALLAAAEENGQDVESRHDYSGRGMFGKTTSAIICDNINDLLALVVVANVRVKESHNEAWVDFTRDLSSARTIAWVGR